MNAISSLALHHEHEIASNLKTAATLAWESQAMEPGSHQRVQQLVHALTVATQVRDLLQSKTQSEVSETISRFAEPPKDRLAIRQETLDAVRRLRQTCLACSLRAAIQAEGAGGPSAAATSLEKDWAVLSDQLLRLGQAFIRGTDSESTWQNSVYDELLDPAWVASVPAARLEMWTKRFDHTVGGVTGIVEMRRKVDATEQFLKPYQSLEYISPSGTFFKSKPKFDHIIDLNRKAILAEREKVFSARKELPTFLDLLDGAWEDVDRLGGHVSEYRTAGHQGMSIQTYRDALSLRDIRDDSPPIVFLLPKASAVKTVE